MFSFDCSRFSSTCNCLPSVPTLKAQLESCDQVTAGSLTQLVATASPLTQLTLKHCQLVTHHDFQQLNALVRAEGLDLTIEWD